MKSIFVSYAHDDLEAVERVVAILRQSVAADIWFDRHLRGGDEYFKIIAREIHRRDVFLFIGSKASFRSPWCVRELNYAKGKNKRIITVRIDDTPVPEGTDLELAIFDSQYIFAHRMTDQHLSREFRESFLGGADEADEYDPEKDYQDGLEEASLPLPDMEKAVACFRRAAEHGHAKAQFNLGVCYDKGQGVPQDYAEAARWYRMSAEQGDAKAQFNLGFCYYEGQGVPQDYAEAVRWFRMAAGQGHAKAQLKLGICYDLGKGVAQDCAEAARWFRMAAGQGDATAQLNLGICYHFGRGVTQDCAEAVRWFRMAAEQGDAVAQSNLGVCCYNGRGVDKNPAEALRWLRKAADGGDEDAKAFLKKHLRFGRLW